MKQPKFFTYLLRLVGRHDGKGTRI